MMKKDDYSTIAPYYEMLLGKPLALLRRNIRTFIQFHNHRHIIDICCGTGRQLEMLADGKRECTGLDISDAMLKQSHAMDSIHFIKQDATNIDLPEQSFDAAILSFALHEKNGLDGEIILDKSWKLVREGGHLIIADYNLAPPGPKAAFYAHFLIPLLERAAGKRHYINYKYWMQSGGLEKRLEHLNGRQELISTHFGGAILVCAVEKEDHQKKLFQIINFNQT